MRSAQKQEVLDCIDSLYKAGEEIREALKRNDNVLAQNMLSQCQEFAVSLGENIEKLEGEKHATVSCLEEYCEALYRVYSELDSGTVNFNKLYKMLKKPLLGVESSAKHDIRARREVVFLPYKASMWDSLESIWRAAEEDGDTDAYVIPIPYYDKRPDGSFGEMHYEGGQYPEYVPVVWYEDYDFEKRRPDMTFIHNPYDECNYVTSVAPFFYSSNLKKITERLVYIPYFVLGEIEPENRQALEELKKFCLVPGVFYADQVIVQSEKMRQAYINVLMEFTAGQNGYERAYWEKKILGLGSPKIDKILATGKEKLTIPEDWMKVIRRPDGSFKRIILYNTSVTALLNHSEQYLVKMRDVFRVFYERRDTAALLWRPHPLIRATIASMRPELWEAYEAIVTQYKSEGWGIYDDTADLDRAVALSDAYYGDESSVVRLYQETGKPVMIQNVYSLPENNYSMAMDNIVEYEGEWWFLALKDNGLYRMNKDTYEATLVKRIPYNAEYSGDHPQYGKIHIYKRKIFAIPMLGDVIAVYDMDRNEIHYIKYGKSAPSRGTVFAEKIEYRNKLYLIPCGYDSIVSVDLETEKVRNISMEEETIVKNKIETFYAWGSVFQNENKIFFTKILDDQIVCFNLDSEETTIYECELLKDGGAGICGNEKYIWIVPRKTGQILRWDREKRKLEIFNQFPDGYQAGDWSFHKIWLDDKLYLLPRDANMCIEMNLENGNMRSVRLDRNEERTGNLLNRYMPCSNIWKNEDKVQMITTQVGTVLSFGKEKDICRETIKISREFSNTLNWQGLVYERQNRFENIENYIVADLFCGCGRDQERNIGQKIFEVN